MKDRGQIKKKREILMRKTEHALAQWSTRPCKPKAQQTVCGLHQNPGQEGGAEPALASLVPLARVYLMLLCKDILKVHLRKSVVIDCYVIILVKYILLKVPYYAKHFRAAFYQ